MYDAHLDSLVKVSAFSGRVGSMDVVVLYCVILLDNHFYQDLVQYIGNVEISASGLLFGVLGLSRFL